MERAKIKVVLGQRFRDTQITDHDGKMLCIKGIRVEPFEHIEQTAERPGTAPDSDPRPKRKVRDEMDLTLVFGPHFYELPGIRPGGPTTGSEGYSRPQLNIQDPRYLAAIECKLGTRDLMIRGFKLESDLEDGSINLSLSITKECYEIEWPKKSEYVKVEPNHDEDFAP